MIALLAFAFAAYVKEMLALILHMIGYSFPYGFITDI